MSNEQNIIPNGLSVYKKLYKNLNLDTDLYIALENSLPEAFTLEKTLSSISLYHKKWNRIYSWIIDKDGNIDDFTPDGIINTLRLYLNGYKPPSDHYIIQNLKIEIRNYKIDKILLDN